MNLKDIIKEFSSKWWENRADGYLGKDGIPGFITVYEGDIQEFNSKLIKEIDKFISSNKEDEK